MAVYLEHVCVFVVAVLHHHGLVPRQRVRDTVLAFAVHSLIKKINKKGREREQISHSASSSRATRRQPLIPREAPEHFISSYSNGNEHNAVLCSLLCAVVKSGGNPVTAMVVSSAP